MCVQPTVDYIGDTRTVGVVWVCHRFEYSHFCRRFGVAFLTIDRATDFKAPIVNNIGLLYASICVKLHLRDGRTSGQTPGFEFCEF